jgi:DMSO reductase anchor subunit
MTMPRASDIKETVLGYQKNEVTEYHNQFTMWKYYIIARLFGLPLLSS